MSRGVQHHANELSLADKSESEARPKVTVALAVYNQERCLKASMEAILSQSLSDMELLCVDDGSTDASPDIMRDVASHDGRVRIITKENGGEASARNVAIEQARGEYFIINDPDDRFATPVALEKLYHAAKDNHVLVSAGSFSIRDDETGDVRDGFSDDPLLWGYTFKKAGLVRYRDWQFDYGHHRFLIETDFLRSHRNLRYPPYARYTDPPYIAAVLLAADAFYAVPDVVYEYSLGHQDIPWSPRQKLDQLKGLTDEISFSADNDLPILHDLAVRRLESEYAGLYWWLLDEDPDLLAQAARLNSSIRPDMLGREMHGLLTDDGAHAPLSFPLRQQLANSAKWHKDVHDLDGAVHAERHDKEEAWKVIDDLRTDVEGLKCSIHDAEADRDAAIRRACEVEEARDDAVEARDDAFGRLAAVEGSLSFRVGRAITAIPRGIRNAIRGK